MLRAFSLRGGSGVGADFDEDAAGRMAVEDVCLAAAARQVLEFTDIEPGLCGGTEFSVVRFGGDQQRADKVYTGTTPLTADDIAEAVLWTTLLPAQQ